MCTNIEPFIVQASPQEPDYWDPGPIPPLLLDIFFPDPGDSPSGHDPQDPCEWNCPMIFDVTIWCETNVPRGEDGRCELEVDPAELLDHVYGWEFRGKGSGYDGLLAYSQQYHETHWEGPIVASGEVRVDFRVKDEFDHTFDLAAKTEIAVVPRTGGEWEWASGDGISYDQGGIPFPQSHEAIGVLCHPDQGCAPPDSTVSGIPPFFWLVQPQEPDFGAPNGYSRAQVPNGPNEGLWYVEGVSTDLRMASAVNPEYFQNGTAVWVDCYSSAPLNFWEYNQHLSCGGLGPGWAVLWHDWVWDHEDDHAAAATQFVTTYQHHQVPRTLEQFVAGSATAMQLDVAEVVEDSGHCVTWSAAVHHGFSLPTFSVWFRDGAEFWEWQPSMGAASWPGWNKPNVPSDCLSASGP